MKSARSAFTLLELLIVVAIVALLISLLMPALAISREQGRRAKCASNLHQLAAAWHCYLAEEGNDQFVTPGGNSQWFYGGKVEIYAVPSGPNGPAILNPRPLNRYVSHDPSGNRAAEIFHCPSDRGATGLPDPAATGRTTYDYMGNSYPLNGTIANGRPRVSTWQPGDAVQPLRLVDIAVPPSLFVLGGDHQMQYAGNSAYRALWHDRAGLTVNLAFLDGHVAFTTIRPRTPYSATYSFSLRWTRPLDEEDD